MKTYEDILSDIALKTQELIIFNKSYFQEKVKDFLLRYNYWKDQLFAGQREALKNKKILYVGKMPKFADKYNDVDDFGLSLFMEQTKWRKSVERKHPRGYILYNPYEIGFSNYSDFMIRGIQGYYWGKPLPENPIDTLRIRCDSTIMHPPYLCKKEFIEREPRDENEDLLRKYFLLAVIHANVGHFGLSLLAPENEVAHLVWVMYQNLKGEKEHIWGSKIRGLMATALKDVKADIKQHQKQNFSVSEENMNFEESEQYKTPEEYFKSLDEFKSNPSNFRGMISLTNPLLCFMDAIDKECSLIINHLIIVLDLVKRKKAGDSIINDSMIHNVLGQASQKISHLVKQTKRGYWGYKWGLLLEMRKVLVSLSRSIFLKITRSPLNYLPEEFDLIEKDMKILNNINIQHVDLKETFNKRLNKMSFDQAVEILKHNSLVGEGNVKIMAKKDKKRPKAKKVGGKSMCDQVFICYSHKDKRWLNDLQTHLKPYVRNGAVTTWSDEQIRVGSIWFSEIKMALASTKVAVLLVTKDFLASDFIHEHELTPLLKEAEKGNVKIIWISVRACAYRETLLKNYQAANNPDKPLANMKADRDKTWVRICEEIKKLAVFDISK